MKSNMNKLKRQLMPFLMAYVIIDIVVVGAICAGLHEVPANSELYDILKAVFGSFMNNIVTFKFFAGIFLEFLSFLKGSFYLLIITAILFIAWKIKFAPISEYEGRENGSSDWSKHGEEFDKLSDGREILNKKEGFILSKDHYLGTDLKKVLINKNILVVGRIWCW